VQPPDPDEEKPDPKQPDDEEGGETEEAEEFFYIDDDGSKADAALHNRILREVEWPINEAIMGPIREKHRAKRQKSFGDAWNEALHPRGKGGKWTESGAGASNAASLYTPPTKTADQIIATVQGASQAIDQTRTMLSKVVETNKLVEEGGFKLADGSYTLERSLVHERIVAEFINEKSVRQYSPEPGENPTLTILGGRGGSGKSWLTSKDGPIDTSRAMVIDNDEVKSKLPEYEGWNAAQLHEEASDIVALIDSRAAALGLNVVLDGTLKSSSILERVKVYQAPEDSEYEMEGFYMYASPETAATRALNRFSKGGTFTGRFVPPEVILSNTKNEINFDSMTPSFRRWAVYDNEGEGKPKLFQSSKRVSKR
jgi:predicted ABC-type ATPase